jgi:hypothetical protein
MSWRRNETGSSVDDEVLAVLDHHRQVVERDIGACAGVVEAPVGVFLDDDVAVFLGHVLSLHPITNRQPGAVLQTVGDKPMD